jgi:hypothetical protein
MAGVLCWLVLMMTAPVCAADDKKPSVRMGSIWRRDVKRIEKYLDGKPFFFGRPIGDRAVWDTLAGREEFKHYIPDAEKLIDAPIEPLTEAMYLDYYKTGRRSGYNSHVRRSYACTFAMAECLENQGRFIAPFERYVKAICDEPTWVIPAHDNDDADNYYGRTVDIELFSALWGWQLATCESMLGDKLDPEIRSLIRRKLHEFVLDPVREMVMAHRPENNWMRTESNWNAVCWSGVTGTALAILESKEDRAFFIEAARSYSRYYLRSFTSDGYCSEGVGYWNFGYGHFVILAEMIYQATHGKMDLFAHPEARPPASYAARIEILNGLYPSFADCSVNAQPNPAIMSFVNRRFKLGIARWNQPIVSDEFPTNLMTALPNSASEAAPAAMEFPGPGVRSWFDQAGILIVRPQPESSCRLAAALKGGSNGEHHNHNDVGSFVVVVGKELLLVDPGSEVYTRRTFSNRRYDSKVLNSWGHSVPVVAGTLQTTGRQAYGKVTHLNFTDDVDTVTFDLQSAYAVPELTRLERTFTYDRRGQGTLTVMDEAAFTEPKSFETAVITLSGNKRLAPDTMLIQGENEAVRIAIDTGGNPFEIREEQIQEEVHTKNLPTRLAIALTQPARAVKITLRITPEPK